MSMDQPLVQPSRAQKEAESREIAEKTKAFLAAGGKITRLEEGDTGFKPVSMYSGVQRKAKVELGL